MQVPSDSNSPSPYTALRQYGFSSGLIQSMMQQQGGRKILWLIDNSGSMQTRDAHRTWGNSQSQLQLLDCSRWEEVQDCLYFQMDMAAILQMHSTFTMVNDLGKTFGPSTFVIGGHTNSTTNTNLGMEVQTAKTILSRAYPTGATPLTKHVQQLQQLQQQQQWLKGKTTIVLITDGLPSDDYGNEGYVITQKFINALKGFQHHGIYLVIRLCTDDDAVVDFYNGLDAQLTDVTVDVLDDYYGEAVEVYLRNPWLNYALPLHRYRESGFYNPILDSIDERSLTLPEIHSLCTLLFATPIPHPTNLSTFCNAIHTIMNQQETLQWNPIHKRTLPWIDLQRLHSNYSNTSATNPRIPPSITKQAIHHNKHQPAPTTTPYHYNTHFPNNQTHNTTSTFHSTPNNNSNNVTSPSTNPTTTTMKVNSIDELKKQMLTQWALLPPSHQTLRPLFQLITTMHQNFPPAYGLTHHDYFQKWKPFSQGSLTPDVDVVVLKKAVRKTRVFLHPDKRPKNIDEHLEFLFKMLWDIISDAWEATSK